MRVAGCPWYIDAKYYSERTLDAFQMTPDDPDWTPKLNEADFQRLASAKLARIQSYHQPEAAACKLIYLNLASTNDRARRYLDTAGQFVTTADEAQILVVQGMLDSQQPDTYTDAFQGLLDDLRHLLNNAQGV
jgi:hypothetical protein